MRTAEHAVMLFFDYRSKDEELKLVDVEKFYSEAPAEISRQVCLCN